MESVPPMCAGGCGFYGYVENKNLCSKCYNDFLKEQIAKSIMAVEDTCKALPSLRITSNYTSTTRFLETSSSRRTKRCCSCRKKVGLLGFNCKCRKVFCSEHRYPEEHFCPVDFKTAGRQHLASQLPLVKPDKLNRI